MKTEKRFDELTVLQQAEVKEHLKDGKKRTEALFVFDEHGSIAGFREAAMYMNDQPMKWMEEIRDLVTGEVLPVAVGESVLLVNANRPGAGKSVLASAISVEAGAVAVSVVDGQLVVHDDQPALSGSPVTHLTQAEIVLGKLNPRREFSRAGIDDLKGSFLAKGFRRGVSQLLVRPVYDGSGPAAEEVGYGKVIGYELVCGERRWRAAGELIAEGKWEKEMPLPVVVEELSDAEVLELQLIENLQREDLSLWEEALGYRHLRALCDVPVSELARRLGKSVRWVERVLSLTALEGSLAGQALAEGRLGFEHGRLLARVPDVLKRDELTGWVLSTNPIQPSRALELRIEEVVMKPLAGCGFDLEDGRLLLPSYDPTGKRLGGGACSDCPFNSRNLQEDARGVKVHGGKKAAMCLNPGCLEEKQRMAHEHWRLGFESDGEAWPYAENFERWDEKSQKLAITSGLVEVSDVPSAADLKHGTTTELSWKKLIAGQGVPVRLIRERNGKVHEVVDRALAIAASLENKHDIFRHVRASGTAERTEITEGKAGGLTAVDAASAANNPGAPSGQGGGEVGKTGDGGAECPAGPADKERRRVMTEREERLEAERERVRALRVRDGVIVGMFDAGVNPVISLNFEEGGPGYELAELCLDAVVSGVLEHDEGKEVCVRHGWAVGDPGGTIRAEVSRMSAPFKAKFFLEMVWMMKLLAPRVEEVPRWGKALGVDLKKIRRAVTEGIEGEEAAKAAEREVAEGMRWCEPHGHLEEHFEWKEDGTSARENFLRVTLPGKRESAQVMTGRTDKGWVTGYAVAIGKKQGFEPCLRNGAHYDNEALAVKAGLLGILQWLEKNGGTAGSVERVKAYVGRAEKGGV